MAWLYGQITQIRRSLYQKGIFKSYPVPVPVISIGNITVGGVGKTPFTLYLAQLYSRWGEKPAILMRGYGRISHEPIILTSENFNPGRVREYGDEAAWLVFASGLPVGIGGDRKQVMELLLKTIPCTRILLDDGFQHRRLRRNLDIVMLDSGSSIGNRWCLPYGPLREPATVLREADALVFHGENAILEPKVKLPSSQERFVGYLQWISLRPFSVWVRKAPNQELSLSELIQRPVTLVSGIGNPERFEQQAKQQGLQIHKHLFFPDHHWYTKEELRQICKDSEGTIIVTTEKDAIRWLLLQDKIINGKEDRIYIVHARWVMKEEDRWIEWLKNQEHRDIH